MAAACLTLAVIHALVWWRRRAARANLLFAVTAVATTFLAAGELWMMRAATPVEFATAVRWSHVPAWVLILALVGFVRLYLRAGSPVLAWTIGGVRTLTLILDFSTGANLNYREVTALRRIPFLGESVSLGVGVANPWMLFGQIGLLLLVVYVSQATLAVWRRGDRRQAAVVGGGILFCSVLGATQSVLVFWHVIAAPIMVSFFYMGIVVAMGFELSRDVIRAAELLEKLTVSERQRMQAADAAALLRQEIARVGRTTILNQLASVVAHEINQPLGAILRNAEAAELFLQRDPPDLAEIRDILGDVCSDIHRAGAVIDRMRALSQRRPLETQRLGVADLCTDVTELTRAEMAARGTRLALRLPDELPAVVADRVHVQQVLLNLVLNGLDAMDSLPPERRVLTLSARATAGPAVEILVADRGPEIPAEQLAQVFDPYYTTKSNGLGMGLPISRTIIEAHGGRLWAEHAPGGGTVFRFTLPTDTEDVSP